MRLGPLLQAVAAVALGFPAYRQPWLGVAAVCVAFAWSIWLTLRTWTVTRYPPYLWWTDALVAMAILVAVSTTIPADLLTTSFNWAAPYAASTALMLGLGMSPRAGGYELVGLIGAYGVLVDLRAGAHALAHAAGNAAGSAAYVGCGIAIACYARRLMGIVDQAEQDALGRAARLGVRQARLDEFGRLHDEAVQVLEQAVVADEPDAALRACAASAADHLRRAIADPNPESGTPRAVLDLIAAGFTARGFTVGVEYGMPLPQLDERAIVTLTAAVTESLNNARKHSGTSCATVRATGVGNGIEVSIADRGTGFVPASVRHGFGMTNSIRRRVGEACGSVEIRSAPGAGTVVRIWLPC